MTSAPEGTQSIVRALKVLKLFDDDHPSWDLQELTDASNLNKTTVFRILGALESEGLIERVDDRRYMLGSEIIALGGRAARVNNLRSISHPHLQQLTFDTGETTTLEVMRSEADGTCWMLVIDEVLGKHLVGITQYIGSRLPIHATSTGKAVLAFSDEQTRQNILAQQFDQFTEETLSTGDDLHRDLVQIQEQGFSMAVGELERGLVAIGAPIFDTNGDVQAAVSLTGPSVRIRDADIAHLATMVCEQTAKISYKLGYRA